MYKLPSKLESFTPYEPLTGNYKVRLDVNESFIETPLEKIVIAIKHAELNRYPDPYAAETVAAFAELFDVELTLVTAGNGSDELIGLIAAGLLEKGDKVLTLTPDFPMYSFYSKSYELEVMELTKSENFVVDIDEVIEYININNIRCLIFSNPCNPTSLGIEKSKVKRLVAETKALIVVDEAYMDFWSEEQSMLDEICNYDNLIVLRTCSKSVALAGIRLGFAVANENITKALKTVKSPFNVNSLSQAIGTAILSDADCYRKSIKVIKENTKALYNALLGLVKLGAFEKVYDTKTNFIFAKTEKAQEVYEFLLSKGIAVRCFPGHLRVCSGTRDEMNLFLKEISAWKVMELEKVMEESES